MSQTKLQSLTEAVSNVAIGFGVALSSQLIIYPLYDIHISFTKNVSLTCVFTVISILRSYVVRRFFNRRHR